MKGRIFIAGAWWSLDPSTCATLAAHGELAIWERKVLKAMESWWDESVDFELKTSGSTGAPRIIRHAKEAMKASAKRTIEALNLGQGTLAALAMPVEFVGGMMMLVRAMEGRWDLLVLEPRHVPKLPDVWTDEKSGDIDFMALTPSQAIALSSENDELWSHLKTLLVGGGALPNSWLQHLQATRTPRILESFGMTETISHFALRERFPLEEKWFRCLPGFEVYTEDLERLVVQTPEGILKTNDLAECYNRHQFIWKGRMDDVIITGGIKVHPVDVEEVLSTVISGEFIVFGAAHDVFGQEIVLRIHAMHPPENASDESKRILDFAISRLPAHHAPKRIEWMPLEKTWTGKWKRPTTS